MHQHVVLRDLSVLRPHFQSSSTTITVTYSRRHDGNFIIEILRKFMTDSFSHDMYTVFDVK